MIARHETHLDKVDIWSALSAPLPPGVISWRQDGRPVTRDGRHIARRRCPECQRIDTVSAHPLALWAWCRRSARQRDGLEHRLLVLIEDAGELR